MIFEKIAKKAWDKISDIFKKESDLLDKTKPLRMADPSELTENLLEKVIEKDSKIWLGNFKNEKVAEILGFDTKYPIKITMQGHNIKHALKRHNHNSNLAKFSGQIPLSYDDIATHHNIVNNADIYAFKKDELGKISITSAKQINGYYVVVEIVSLKKNELSFKTCFKERGKLSADLDILKGARGVVNSQGEPLGAQVLTTVSNLDTSSPTATKIIPQSTKNSRDIFKEIMQEATNAYAKSRENLSKNSKSNSKDLER